MLNIIKYELYRMFNRLSTYVLLMVMCLYNLTGMGELAGSFTDITLQVFEIGFQMVILTIFIILFTCDELNTGYIKALITKIKRYQLVIANVVVSLVFTMIMFALTMVQTFLYMQISGYTGFGSASRFATGMILMLFLHTAFGVFISMLVYLFKNKIIPIIVGIIMVVGVLLFVPIPADTSNGFLKMLLNCTIMGQISSLCNSMTASSYAAPILNITVTLGVCIIVSCLVFQKKDIK